MLKQTIVLVTLIAIIFATVDNTSTVAAQMKKIGTAKADKSEQKAKAAKASNTKAREAKEREAKARQAKAREAKEREDRARQAKANDAREREARARQAKARDAREREEKARDAREREAKARQAKANDAKEREAKARQAKANDAKEREAKARQAKANDAKERADKAGVARAGVARAGEAKEREDRERQAKARDAKERADKAGDARAGVARAGVARSPIPGARVGDPMPGAREREANEREARERRERDANEREARERRERDANEREARERRERDANEREARERREREARERVEAGRNAAPKNVTPAPSASGVVDSRCRSYHSKYAYYNQQIVSYDEKERTTTSGTMRNYLRSRKSVFINDKNKLVTLARNNGCNLSDNPGTGLASPPPSALPPSRVGVDSRCSNYNFRLTSYNRQIAFYDDKANTATSMMSRNSYLSRKNVLVNDKSRLIELARNNGCNLYGSSEPGLAAPPSTGSVPARGTPIVSTGRGQATPPPSASWPSRGDSNCSYYQNKIAEYNKEISDSEEKARSASTVALRNSWLRRKETNIHNKNRITTAARTKGCM